MIDDMRLSRRPLNDEPPGMGEEHFQNPQGLFLKLNLGALLAQLSGVHVQLERAEADDLRSW